MSKQILLVLILAIAIGMSTSTPVQGEEAKTLANLESRYLDNIGFDYLDLDLTTEELQAVERLQLETIHVGLYEIDGYYQDYDGTSIGRHYHTMKQLEQVFDLNITYTTGSFDAIMQNYYDGDFDIVPGLILTGDREDFFHFAEYNVVADIYLYSNDYIDIDDVYDLDGIVLGKQTGMKIVTDEYVDFLAEQGINLTLVEYDDISDAIDDIGVTIDHIVHSRDVDLIQQGLNFMVGDDFLNSYNLILTSSKDEDIVLLMNAIDKAFSYGLERNIVDYGIELEHLMFQEGIYFTEEEKAFIASTTSNPIQVTSSSDWIPYLYENEDGELEGYAYDMFVTLTNNLNLNYQFEFDPSLSWDDMFDTLGQNGNDILYDVAMLDSVTKYEDDFYVYSYPIHTEEAYVVGLYDTPWIENLFELQDENVGIIPFYAATTYLQTNLVFKEFYEYDTLEDMIDALNAGEIDYFALIKSEYEGLYYLQKHYNITPKYSIRSDFDVALLLPLQGENTDILLSLYNKAIVLSDTSSVSEEYFRMQVDLNDVVLRRTVSTIMIGIAVIIVFLTGSTIWYLRTLNQKMHLDELTKLFNRRALFTKTNIKDFAYLYFFDFDNFKDVNDQYGHNVGDEVLVYLTKMFQENFEGNVYRIGGDEFVLLSSTKYDINALRHDRFRYTLNDLNVSVTFSVGAIDVARYDSIDELLRYADFAMYEAKKFGKDNLVFVTDEVVAKYDNQHIQHHIRKQERRKRK